MSDCLRHPFAGRAYRPLAAAATHPGLWFDRFLPEQIESGQSPDSERNPFVQLLDHACAIGKPSLYKPAFRRWLKTLDEMGVRPRVARATYRLAVGHGRESVIETGITLHHTYGVPYIPGSSLKGVAASFAGHTLGGLWRKGDPAHTTLFGATDSAGYIDFLDALPLPESWELQRDVLTVHHPNYYRGEDSAPADWDNPTPVHFLTAVGEFLVALRPADRAEAWADAGYGILKMALEEVGVGGKTSSGYGRMKLGAPLSRVEAGATLRAIIEDVGRSRVTLSLAEPYVLGIPPNKEPDFHIPMNLVGNRQFAPGNKADIVVLETAEDEYDFVVTCRPATREERQRATS